MSDLNELVDIVNNAVTKDRPRNTKGVPVADSVPVGDWAKTVAAAARWAQTGKSFFPVSEVVEKLPAGAYVCRTANTGPYLEQMDIKIDHLMTLPDSATEILLSEFAKFWKLKPAFDERGFTFKRGMLMWGNPGSGKTSAVWQMAQHLICEHDGLLVFIEHPQVAIWCLGALRRIEPHRPIITVMEDLDALIEQYGEHHLLALLDGEFQFANVVHLATTNYPDRLDKRFIDRPSRFDTLMKVGMPSAEARDVYFKNKEPSLDEVTRQRWVRKSEGYSIAHLREICIAIKCFEQSEEDVFNRLDKMKQLIRTNDDGDEREAVGFIRGARNG